MCNEERKRERKEARKKSSMALKMAEGQLRVQSSAIGRYEGVNWVSNSTES